MQYVARDGEVREYTERERQGDEADEADREANRQTDIRWGQGHDPVAGTGAIGRDMGKNNGQGQGHMQWVGGWGWG